MSVESNLWQSNLHKHVLILSNTTIQTQLSKQLGMRIKLAVNVQYTQQQITKELL
jgi:hypothetical protein